MPAKPRPSRGALLLPRDLLARLQDCGKPTTGDDFVHFGVGLAQQLHGAVLYCLRQDPCLAADAVHLNDWGEALQELLAAAPDRRRHELQKLLSLAKQARAPKEG